jgi:hypothetical protein
VATAVDEQVADAARRQAFSHLGGRGAGAQPVGDLRGLEEAVGQVIALEEEGLVGVEEQDARVARKLPLDEAVDRVHGGALDRVGVAQQAGQQRQSGCEGPVALHENECCCREGRRTQRRAAQTGHPQPGDPLHQCHSGRHREQRKHGNQEARLLRADAPGREVESRRRQTVPCQALPPAEDRSHGHERDPEVAQVALEGIARASTRQHDPQWEPQEVEGVASHSERLEPDPELHRERRTPVGATEDAVEEGVDRIPGVGRALCDPRYPGRERRGREEQGEVAQRRAVALAQGGRHRGYGERAHHRSPHHARDLDAHQCARAQTREQEGGARSPLEGEHHEEQRRREEEGVGQIHVGDGELEEQDRVREHQRRRQPAGRPLMERPTAEIDGEERQHAEEEMDTLRDDVVAHQHRGREQQLRGERPVRVHVHCDRNEAARFDVAAWESQVIRAGVPGDLRAQREDEEREREDEDRGDESEIGATKRPRCGAEAKARSRRGHGGGGRDAVDRRGREPATAGERKEAGHPEDQPRTDPGERA